MPLVSVPGLYDGNSIGSLETPRRRELYLVLVTLVDPVDAADVRERSTARFLRSFGDRRDDRPVEATLADIHERLVGAKLHVAQRCSSALSLIRRR